MAKQRFRDVKQGRTEVKKEKKTTSKKKENYASIGAKTKAFLTDAFMLIMPIMYIVFYLIMGGREDFAGHRILGWIYILIPLVIVQTIFIHKTGQTPGYRAYNLTLVDESTQKKPSLFIIIFRNLSAILSMFTLLGALLMFFRKDHKALHDILTGTAVVFCHDKKI